MSRQVKVMVRVGESVRFPGICVQHLTAADGTMLIRHRVGRRTRLIEVPVCTTCQAVLAERSAAEARAIRLSWVVTVTGIVLGAFLGWLLMPVSLWLVLRLAGALGLGVALGALAWTWTRRDMTALAGAEKQATLQSARIVHFSWRATTFEFGNEAYAEEFRALNKKRLMALHAGV